MVLPEIVLGSALKNAELPSRCKLMLPPHKQTNSFQKEYYPDGQRQRLVRRKGYLRVKSVYFLIECLEIQASDLMVKGTAGLRAD